MNSAGSADAEPAPLTISIGRASVGCGSDRRSIEGEEDAPSVPRSHDLERCPIRRKHAVEDRLVLMPRRPRRNPSTPDVMRTHLRTIQVHAVVVENFPRADRGSQVHGGASAMPLPEGSADAAYMAAVAAESSAWRVSS